MSEDLNDLLVFISVVEQGSFTLAGEKLGVPKSNISRKLSRLEQSIGAKLLERSTRSLRLTEVGEVYFRHCLRIKNELDNAKHSVESFSTAVKGTLKIGASLSIGQHVLTPLLAEFKVLYPQIKFNLEFTNRRVDLIEEGFDLVLRVGETPDSNMISKRLCTLDMHLYASKHYIGAIEAHGSGINSIDDLKEQPCLFMNAIDGKTRWQLIEGEKEHYIDITPDIMANDFYSLTSLTEHGLGIALLPDYLALKNTILVKVLPTCVGRQVNLYGIYPSRDGVTPKLRAFLDFVGEQF